MWFTPQFLSKFVVTLGVTALLSMIANV